VSRFIVPPSARCRAAMDAAIISNRRRWIRSLIAAAKWTEQEQDARRWDQPFAL